MLNRILEARAVDLFKVIYRELERVGMQREGILRSWLVHPNVSDTPRDCLCYSVVKQAGYERT